MLTRHRPCLCPPWVRWGAGAAAWHGGPALVLAGRVCCPPVGWPWGPWGALQVFPALCPGNTLPPASRPAPRHTPPVGSELGWQACRRSTGDRACPSQGPPCPSGCPEELAGSCRPGGASTLRPQWTATPGSSWLRAAGGGHPQCAQLIDPLGLRITGAASLETGPARRGSPGPRPVRPAQPAPAGGWEDGWTRLQCATPSVRRARAGPRG